MRGDEGERNTIQPPMQRSVPALYIDAPEGRAMPRDRKIGPAPGPLMRIGEKWPQTGEAATSDPRPNRRLRHHWLPDRLLEWRD